MEYFQTVTVLVCEKLCERNIYGLFSKKHLPKKAPPENSEIAKWENHPPRGGGF